MGKSRLLVFAAFAVCVAPFLHGQDQKAEIRNRITAKYALTKLTDTNADIDQAGAILTLQKEGMVMFSIADCNSSTPIPSTLTYKDGKLSMSFMDALGTDMALSACQSGQNVSNVPQRKFVAGEKCWLTNLSVSDKHVILQVYSDPYDGVRYFGQLKFNYNKKQIPSADDMIKTIAEVVTAEPPPGPSAIAQASSATSAGVARSDPSLAPLAPPPAPDAASTASPKTISVGQSKDEVVAILGQPQKVANLNAKEIDFYPNLKVTFLNGKVIEVR